MNLIVKSAVAGALAVGTSSAFAIGLPQTNSSDLILYVDALTSTGASAGVYALDTGITIDSALPSTGLVSGALNSTKFSIANKTIPESGTLSAFLTANAANSIQWTLMGGVYNGPSSSAAGSSNVTVPGAARAVMTSQILTNLYPTVGTSTTGALAGFLNGLNSDLNSGGLSQLKTATETSTATETLGAPSKYGLQGGSDLSLAGATAIKLFGLTGNNIAGGQNQSYLLGSAVFNGGVLTITGNAAAPVPLPAAVWLFGSGLMGLVGVSRRRKQAATA
jgi:hypothetical protein